MTDLSREPSAQKILDDLTPEYTNTWFTEDVERLWEKHLKHAFYSPIRYLEIGVCEGQSMRWMLENLYVLDATGVDPWMPRRKREKDAMPQVKARAYRNLSPWEDKVRLIQDFSWHALPKLPLMHYDIIYVDGDHRAPEAMLDVCMSFRCLKVGGMMIIDDLHRTWVKGRPQVLPVVHAIPLLFHGRMDLAWKEGRQVAFSKTDN